jgi:hypothetical protein
MLVDLGYLQKKGTINANGEQGSNVYTIVSQLVEKPQAGSARHAPPSAGDAPGSAPDAPKLFSLNYSKGTKKERESPPEKALPLPVSAESDLSLPSFAPLSETETLRARLQNIARERIGAETPHVVHALELVKGGADPDLVVNAWERMLKTKPNSAAFFGKDFATRWKAKQIEDDGHCPECHVRLDLGYLHLRECSRRKSA